MTARRERAQLLLRKAATDEAVLDRILDASTVDDEAVGFHCQQAVEKLLKAVLTCMGANYPKTHSLRYLMDLLADAGMPLPPEFGDLDELTPYGTVFRYDEVAGEPPLDRGRARDFVRRVRAWAEKVVTATP